MARLKAGVAPTPHKERLKGYRAELEKRGGKRISADLEAMPVEALKAIMARESVNAKDAISMALICYARTEQDRALPVTPPKD